MDCALSRFCACVLYCCAVLTGNDLTCTWSTPTLTAPPRLRHVVAMAPKGRMLVFGGQGENDEVFDPLVSTQAQRLATMVCVCVCVSGVVRSHALGVRSTRLVCRCKCWTWGTPQNQSGWARATAATLCVMQAPNPRYVAPSIASREPAHIGVGIAPPPSW